jgi:hypothetical protein
MSSLVPTPDIESNLDSLLHRHAGVNDFFVASSFAVEVQPENCIAFNGLERYTLCLRFLLALKIIAPPLIFRLVQSWEVGLQIVSIGLLGIVINGLTPPPSQSAFKYTMNVLILIDCFVAVDQS